MNKVNGYCQIELPDSVRIMELTSKARVLTKEEAKPIIDGIGLGVLKLPKVRDEEFREHSYEMLEKALIVKPLVIKARTSNDSKWGISHAVLLNSIGTDYIKINFNWTDDVVVHIFCDISEIDNPEKTPTIYDLVFSASAYQITTTQIK